MEDLLVKKKPKILIIDDEKDICVYTQSILERTGKFETLTTTSASEGIALAIKDPPDLILLAIMMTEMDGAEVAEQLQANPGTRGIPIVFVTALVDQKDIKESHGLIGGHYFIRKPAKKEELIACIESLFPETAAH